MHVSVHSDLRPLDRPLGNLVGRDLSLPLFWYVDTDQDAGTEIPHPTSVPSGWLVLCVVPHLGNQLRLLLWTGTCVLDQDRDRPTVPSLVLRRSASQDRSCPECWCRKFISGQLETLLPSLRGVGPPLRRSASSLLLSTVKPLSNGRQSPTGLRNP